MPDADAAAAGVIAAGMLNHFPVSRFEPFNSSLITWDAYQERLEQFFIANDVTDEVKKKALLITSLSADHYKLLTNFFSPASPTSKTFDELCARLKTHFVPEKVEIAEVNRFYRRKQKGTESVQDFLADLRQLAKDCNFGDLNRALRDAFVLGIFDPRIQSRLLSTRNLTLDTALDTAQSMEAAALQTKQLRHPIPQLVMKTTISTT